MVLLNQHKQHGLTSGRRDFAALFRLPLGGALLLGLVTLAAPHAWAQDPGEPVAHAEITLNVSAVDNCLLDTSRLTYDFTSLKVGEPKTTANTFSISCTSARDVKFDTSWDGKLLDSSTHTFSNNDTLVVEFCNADGQQCGVAPDGTTFKKVEKRTIALKLTYKASAPEAPLQRSGTLLVTFP